ncbi:MAG: hypothetical protein IPK19_21595 [Chloroflexi bacterium]|nr:hypothetical protein [Chloroflexota bacterium]
MRIPGVGGKGADKILRARQNGLLRTLDDLRGIGITGVERAADFITLAGKRPERQLPLF